MSNPALEPDPLDEDLFDFGSMNPKAEGVFADEVPEEEHDQVADELVAELDAALEVSAQESGAFDEFDNPFDFDSITAAASASDGPPDAGDQGSSTAPDLATTAKPSAGASNAQGTPAATGGRMVLGSSRIQLALAAMIAFNLLLVGLSWRSQGSTRELIKSLGVAQAPAQEAAPERTSSRRQMREAPLIEDLRAEGYETLDEAQRAIERGEFQVAREMLFALLAVIDRVDDRARYDVEARAAFLIGDAFRFEADAVALAGTDADTEGGNL